MFRKLNLIIWMWCIFCLCFIFQINNVQAASTVAENTEFTEWNDSIQIVDAYKCWKIEFSQDVDLQTATRDNIYVLDSDQAYSPVRILPGNKNNELFIDCPENGYESKEYNLFITSGLKSAAGLTLEQGIMLRFYVINQ